MNRLGAIPLTNQNASFRVWAPKAKTVEIWIGDLGAGKAQRLEPLHAEGGGYFSATLSSIEPGVQYRFRIDGELDRPDPASRLQSDGVHGPSRLIDLAFDWHDAGWRGVPLSKYVIYELHVGTFSRAGTFAGVAAELERLKKLGVTAIELMPVAQFPGERNWGYDGVYPFAVQSSYGGPKGLQRLVDECHRVGLAVVLDVVYNHLGPEGNYLSDFGPYFTERYQTPWGRALNFDGSECEGVRRFFLENALMWFEDFHIDALRLDAVHAIIDRSAKPFLEELGDAVHRRAETVGRHWYLIAESDLNDPRVVRTSDIGGLGLDAMWCDDYHHAAHVLVTGEKAGYYADFGRVEDMARAFARGMSQPGEYSVFRQRRHGRAGPDLAPEQCVVCTQNHDQIGNRLRGERLDVLVGFEQQKLIAGLTCLSRFVPLLFMGQEYGETAPFQYFISHGDAELVAAVQRGRREEFASFALEGEAPDPASPATFERCVLDADMRHTGRHAILHQLYQTLLELRETLPQQGVDECIAFESRRILLVRRGRGAWIAFSFSDTIQTATLPVTGGSWQRLLSSAEREWSGPGSRAPARIDSTGEVTLEIEPFSLMIYVSTDIAD
jgi:maltooligosyltrehalose trehalohydrolase